MSDKHPNDRDNADLRYVTHHHGCVCREAKWRKARQTLTDAKETWRLAGPTKLEDEMACWADHFFVAIENTLNAMPED